MRLKWVKPGQTYTETFELKGPLSKVMTTTRTVLVKDGRVLPDSIALDDVDESANAIVRLNTQGHRIHEVLYLSRGRKMVRDYNGQGLCAVQENYENGELKQTTLLEYDAAGRSLSNTVKRPNGHVAYRSESVYRPDGQLLENSQFNGHNGTTSHIYLHYDEKGRRVAIEVFDGTGELERTHTYAYDDKGRCTEEAITYLMPSMESESTKTVYAHNAQGDIVLQTIFDGKGQVKQEYSYTHEYDSEGKRIMPQPNQQTEYREDVLHTDRHGNWTARVVYHRQVPMYAQERTLVYTDEPDTELVHPMEQGDTARGFPLSEPIEETRRLSAKALRWVMEQPGITPDQFPVMRYYTARFKEPPTVVNYALSTLENRGVYKELTEHYHAFEVHSYHHAYSSQDSVMTRYTLELPYYEGYMVQAYNITSHDPDSYKVPDHLSDAFHYGLHFGPIMLLCPGNTSARRNLSFELLFRDIMDRYTVDKLPSRPRIHVIEVRNNSFAVVEHPVSDSFTIRDLDINYGEGFSKFHTELMDRFKSGSKGLVLFHGVPGTGKTYYIRHLLRQMAGSKKRVIYMPPNMVDHLTDPSFMTFLIDTIKRWSREGRFCVLLIEDAEPLLAKRQEGVRIQGVTNLLNMTDGLLNDMLNLQIICTFNVDLRKLDSALLRPGRLLARKEFKALNELDANILASRLGIKHHFKGPASLSEIYAMLKDSSTLVHDVDPDRDSSTGIDDIL
jgi:hypothetical protein